MNLWTDEQKEMLRVQYESGATFSEIVAAINGRFGTNYTRNAAIGRAHRMDLPPRPSPIRLKVEEPEPERIVRKPKFKAEQFTPRVEDVASLRKTIVEVAFTGECKWPDNERNAAGETTVCGNPAGIGCSWCEAHKRLLWYPRQTPTKQKPHYRNERRRAA